MIIKVPISIGELLDKISILSIKEKKIIDKEKILLIKKELSLLKNILDTIENDEKIISDYLEKLIKINSKLWEIEDKLKELEKNKIFDNSFIDLARAVYLTNDKRSEIKSQINNNFGSEIAEVKSYSKY